MDAVGDGVWSGGLELGNVEDGVNGVHGIGEREGEGMGTGFGDDGVWT